MMDAKNGDSKRLRRERRTLVEMIALYCGDCHAPANGICEDCRELIAYANERLDRCIFRDDKPPCRECPVHCYRESMRKRITEVMRYAGPRMLRRHPYLAVMHLIDGRRKSANKRK